MTEVVRGQNFKVGPRYAGLDFIGEGAYGMVVYVIWGWHSSCCEMVVGMLLVGTAVVELYLPWVALALQYT